MSQEATDWDAEWGSLPASIGEAPREAIDSLLSFEDERHDKPPVTLKEFIDSLATESSERGSPLIEHHDEAGVLRNSLDGKIEQHQQEQEESWTVRSDSLLGVRKISLDHTVAPVAQAQDEEPAQPELLAPSYNDPAVNDLPTLQSSETHAIGGPPLRQSFGASSLADSAEGGFTNGPCEPAALKRNPKYPAERLSKLLNMELEADDTVGTPMPSMVDYVEDFMAKFSKFFISGPPPGTPARILLTDLRSPAEKGRITMQLLAALGKKLLTTSNSRNKRGLKLNLWADIFHPTSAEIQILAKAFSVHALTAEDICTDYTRVKLEEYQHYLYVVLREDQVAPGSNIRELMPLHLLIFPHMGITLTIHPEPINAIASVMFFVDWEDAGKIEHTGYVLYKHLDTITDQFMAIVDGMWTEVQSLDKLVIRVTSVGDRTDLILRTAAAAQRIAGLRNTLLAQQEILRSLLGTKLVLSLHPTTKIYLRDVDDHLTAMLQRLDMSTEMLNNTNATNLAMISLLMTDSANQVNEVMKRFSAVATIVLPMTLVSSLWGMNIMVPGQTWPTGPANLVWFFLICLLMGCWFVAGVFWLRAREWF